MLEDFDAALGSNLDGTRLERVALNCEIEQGW